MSNSQAMKKKYYTHIYISPPPPSVLNSINLFLEKSDFKFVIISSLIK